MNGGTGRDMAPTATQIFEFIASQDGCELRRNEAHSAAFAELRSHLRQLIDLLRDVDDAVGASMLQKLRAVLSELLTVPVPFDATLADRLAFADSGHLNRWGRDAAYAFEAVRDVAALLASFDNPLRASLTAAFESFRAQRIRFRILCHRQAVPHFQSLVAHDPSLITAPDDFLHSTADYRDSALFDVLVKVGPLRSQGWGRVPDALLTAPRFRCLEQFVWAGCPDEDGFGFDPVAPASVALKTEAVPASTTARLDWLVHVTRSGDEFTPTGAVEDDLTFVQRIPRLAGLRKAVLVDLSSARAVLYPPHAKVLSFDATDGASEPIEYRIPGEALVEGHFLAWPEIEDPDFGEVNAEQGQYSRIWKQKLRQEKRRDQAGLLKKLSAAGIDLVSLPSCVVHWCKDPTTVIPAPQQRQHFRMLIDVLREDFRTVPNSARHRRPPWEYAWHEIAMSRVKAIQAGLQEQALVDEELITVLQGRLPDLISAARTHDTFRVELPEGDSLSGAVTFFRVLGLDSGFLAPDTAFRRLMTGTEANAWRE
jgi:hypothetical protein